VTDEVIAHGETHSSLIEASVAWPRTADAAELIFIVSGSGRGIWLERALDPFARSLSCNFATFPVMEIITFTAESGQICLRRGISTSARQRSLQG
jgi:hypothetical protein